MNRYHQNTIEFLPPQVYEFSRLGNFRKLSDLSDVLNKCKNHPEYHVERMLGICYKIPQAMIIVMPGDAYYPCDASYTTPVLSLNKTLEEFDSEVQNRLIMISEGRNQKWQVIYKNSNENKTNQINVRPLTNGWEKL